MCMMLGIILKSPIHKKNAQLKSETRLSVIYDNITDSISSKMSSITQREYRIVNDLKWVIKHWQGQKEQK